MGKQVIDLDRTQREKGQQLQVQAGAERGGEAVLRGGGSEYWIGAGTDGFVCAADQNMREGRNGSGKAKLRAEEIRFQVRVRTLVRPGSVAVFSGESEWAQNF